MLNHPAGLFSGDYNSALRGCWPLKFLHILQLPEMYFKSYLGRRAASVGLCPIFLLILYFENKVINNCNNINRQPENHEIITAGCL